MTCRSVAFTGATVGVSLRVAFIPRLTVVAFKVMRVTLMGLTLTVELVMMTRPLLSVVLEVMIAVPTPLDVTIPRWLTVATLVLLLDQVTLLNMKVLRSGCSSMIVLLNCSLSPMMMSMSSLLIRAVDASGSNL